MIQIENLSKIYSQQKKVALQDVSLHIHEGEFTALLGQNGAGKSTLINILSGNVKKTGGKVFIGGFDLDRNELETKRIIGVVPQEISFDYVFTVDEVLKAQSGYFGLRNNGAYIRELLDSLSLSNKRNSRVRELSGGMKRRLLIAKALVHKPKVLILDEPTAGVDIELRHSMHRFLQELHKSGTTIILTTHYLDEAEKLCKRIVIVDSGNILADAPKEDLLENDAKEIKLEVHFDKELSEEDVNFLKNYNPVIEQKTKLHLKVLKEDISKVFQELVQQNMEFVNLIVERHKLEDIYLDLIRK